MKPSRRDHYADVMAGLGLATHALLTSDERKSWVTGSSPVMTQEAMSHPDCQE